MPQKVREVRTRKAEFEQMKMGKEFMPEVQKHEEAEQKTSRPNSLELNEQFMGQHGYPGQQYTGQFPNQGQPHPQGHPGAPPPGPPGHHPQAQQQGQYAYSNGPVSRASMAQYAAQQGQGYPNQQHMQYNHHGEYPGHYAGDLQNNMAAAESPQQSPSKQRGMPRSGSGNVNSPMRPSQPPPAPPPGAMMNNKDSPMGSRSGSASRDSLPPPPPPPPSEQGGQIQLGRATPPYTGAGMANAMQGQRAVNSPVRGVAGNITFFYVIYIFHLFGSRYKILQKSISPLQCISNEN